MTWRGEAGRGEDVAGAGTMTVVQTVLRLTCGHWPETEPGQMYRHWLRLPPGHMELRSAASSSLEPWPEQADTGGARHKAGPG